MQRFVFVFISCVAIVSLTIAKPIDDSFDNQAEIISKDSNQNGVRSSVGSTNGSIDASTNSDRGKFMQTLFVRLLFIRV